MKNRLVYDLPMRAFHWLFAGLFATAFLIAKAIDDDSPAYSYHMLAGLVLGFAVLLRIIWGVVGTQHSRFASFALHPRDALAYFRGILSGTGLKWVGHNPASSWAALIMMGLALGLGITGYLMVSENSETFEDLHELLAIALLIVALMHIAGVVLHALRHRDGIALSMITGRKGDVPPAGTIAGSKPFVALAFLGLVAAFSLHLAQNFDGQKQTLNLLGTPLRLTEDKGGGDGHDGHDDHDDHDD